MIFLPNTRVKGMQLHEHLGSGAFGSVFRATDVLMNRECAIKFIENKNPNEFKAHIEGQILNQCQHDNVVKVHGVDIYSLGNTHYAGVEMELMRDGSAEAAVGSRFLSIRDVTKLGIDVLFALEHTHRNGVIHRDIKPPNIMLHGNSAKLSDFGVATAPGVGANASAAGSPAYNAPEVHTQGITNVMTDIFSVGMSLFQLYNNYLAADFVSGITSFSTIERGETIDKIGYQHFVPRRVRTICNKACATEPTARFRSAKEFRQALEGLRVLLDWHRQPTGVWTGSTYGKQFSMSIEPSKREFCNVFKQGARRVTARCTMHGNHQLAISAQEKIVYETTFAGI